MFEQPIANQESSIINRQSSIQEGFFESPIINQQSTIINP